MPSKYYKSNISTKQWASYGATSFDNGYEIDFLLIEGATSGTYTTYDLNECIIDVKLTAGFDDNLFHGLELAKQCTVTFDYDLMPSGLRTILKNEVSSGSMTINGVSYKKPNRLVLKYKNYIYEGGDSFVPVYRLHFDGFQLKKNKSNYKYEGKGTKFEVTFTSIEKYIFDICNFGFGLDYLYDNSILKINSGYGQDSGEYVAAYLTQQYDAHYTLNSYGSKIPNSVWHVSETHLLEAMQDCLNTYYQAMLGTANELILSDIIPDSYTFYKVDDEETEVTPHFIVAIGNTNSDFATWKTKTKGGLLGDGGKSISENGFVKLGTGETLKRIAETFANALLVNYDQITEYDIDEVPDINLEMLDIYTGQTQKPRLEGLTDGSNALLTLTNCLGLRPDDLLLEFRADNNAYQDTYTVSSITWDTDKFRVECQEPNFGTDNYLIPYKVIKKIEVINFEVFKLDDLTLIEGKYSTISDRASSLDLGRNDSEESLEYELIFNNVPDKFGTGFVDINGLYEPRAGWNSAYDYLTKVSMNTTGADSGGYSSNDSKVLEEETVERLDLYGIAVQSNATYNSAYNGKYELKFDIKDGRFSIHDVYTIFVLDLELEGVPTAFRVTSIDYTINGDCTIIGRSL